MEPMALGSAPSSPASPSANPNFLPAFLMGDSSQPSTPNPSTSPGRNRTPSNIRKLGLNTPDSRNLHQKFFNQSLIESPIPQKQGSFTSQKSGPPKQGLFDMIEQKKKASPLLNSTPATFSESPAFGKVFSRTVDDSFNYNRNNLNDSRFDKIDTNWVTVFGFTPSALSLVLAQFSNCGTIVEKKLPSEGNWVHIKFANYNEVARALTLNGRCINNCVMIGVCLYYHKENKENDSDKMYTSPIRARPLGQSFVSLNNSNTVILPETVPQKSAGFVSKAIEYVFGWQ